MAAWILPPADKVSLSTADKAYVLAALANLKALPAGEWLSANHPHKDGQLPKDDATYAAVLPSQVIESIAIRGPLHCVDGWGFVSRSLEALLSGDPHAARHFSYYAELRAALSILASHGIGNFNYRNLIVDGNGVVAPLTKKGTHDFCWAALSAWAELPGSFKSIADAISLGGVTLYDATTAFYPVPASGMLAQNLIEEWGFDLNSGAEDKDERNLSSYNPNDLSPMPSTTATDLDFVQDLWAAFEPDRWFLEKHMLRKILDLQQTVHGALSPAEQDSGYEKLDARAQAIVSKEFLFHVDRPANSVLLARAADPSRPARAESMIARSALLLRLATSLAEANFAAAAVQPLVHREAWWKQFGAERGLWTQDHEPVDMADLWYEVEDALIEVGAVTTGDRYAWFGAIPTSAGRLHETERIALWNICR